METPTTPTNEGYRDTGDVEPHIPEPDYDMSDVDTGEATENHHNDGNNGGTATLRRRGRSVRGANDMERKKKKTVSFIMNEELANIIHSSGTMTKRDSILKDPSRERDTSERSSRPAKRSPSKVTPPLTSSEHTSPSLKSNTQHPAWSGGSIMDSTEPKLASASKIRIEVGNNNNSRQLHKSQSFSSTLSPMSDAAGVSGHSQASSGQGGISQEDLLQARSLLKSSRSFPELLEDGDNSSSGVSSDQDQDTIIVAEEVTKNKDYETKNKDYVTKLTVSDTNHGQQRGSRSVSSSRISDRSVTMTGPIGAVNIEYDQEPEQEHHYQNFASMMQSRSRTRSVVHSGQHQTPGCKNI